MPNPTRPVPPSSPRMEPRRKVMHGDLVIDHFAWFRDRESPELQAWIDAEHRYAEASVDPDGDRTQRLMREASGAAHIPAGVGEVGADDVAPTLDAPAFRRGPYEYFARHEPGRELPVWCRRRVGGGDAEVVLDPASIEGSGHFFKLGVFEPSEDGRWLACSYDLVGNEAFSLAVVELPSGRIAGQPAGRAGTVAWSADSRHLWYTLEQEGPRRWRWLGRLDVSTGGIDTVFEELEEQRSLAVRRSDDGRWLFVDVRCTNDNESQGPSAEVWAVPADDALGDWHLVVSRTAGVRAYVEAIADTWILRVDDHGPFDRLVAAPIAHPDPGHWRELLPHRAGTTLDDVRTIGGHIVVQERTGLRPRVVVLDAAGHRVADYAPAEASCSLTIGEVPDLGRLGAHYARAIVEPHARSVRVTLESFLTPPTVLSVPFGPGMPEVVRPGTCDGIDVAQYVSGEFEVPAGDGMVVPVSTVMRRDRAGAGPVLIWVYGCYGYPEPPQFSRARFSLLDRGWACAIAHVRGGGDLGRPWHDQGRLARKPTTYTDLIAVAEGLIAQGIAAPGQVAIGGRSAGGGTVLNAAAMRPDLFGAVYAAVPVPDNLDTQYHNRMPWAVLEAQEWGDPSIRADYDVLRTYDAYHNLAADRPLPPTLVDGFFDDGQVLFWQPARYVAQRRNLAAGRDPRLLLRLYRRGGHAGPSHGPDVAYGTAFAWAWLIETLGGTGAGDTR